METIKRICRKCKPHARFAIIGFVALILANATRLILPLISGWIVDDVIKGGILEKLPGFLPEVTAELHPEPRRAARYQEKFEQWKHFTETVRREL